MNGRYIIFADDDEDDMELVTGFFKKFDGDTKIVELKNGREVLRFLDRVNSSSESLPLLIVLDINMPRMDGMSTLQAIRKHEPYRNIAVVIYTTSMSRSNIQLCKELDATWIVKPSSISGIEQTARNLVDFCNRCRI